MTDRKHTMRRDVVDSLRSMDAETRRQDEDVVHRDLRALVEARGAQTIFVYLADTDELNLDSIVAEWIEGGRRLAAPRLRDRRGEMEAAELGSLAPTSLDVDRYGLRSPKASAPAIAVDAFDLIVVPGVAFTLDGHRLGRGGGYYDRWLALLPESTPRIGVCHRVQIVEAMPIEAHDRPMHRVLTGPRA